MKVFLDSIGCRLNQSEIEKLAMQLRAAGHTIVGSAAEADWVVVNTCAVTAEAASDSRQKVRQAARAGVQDITVTGCWATLEPQAALALPGVKQVVTNERKEHLVAERLGVPLSKFDLEPLAREPLPGLRQRTRAFLKVQDGCDNHCTFCVTRLARGKGRSRGLEEVLTDARMAQAGGVKEIVLTGVHLGSWGQDFSPSLHLYDLVSALLEETNLPRIRLSSLEPWDLDERFFSLWQNPRLCRHLHLPLQSGCAETLRRMARKTSPDSFMHLVEMARKAVPEIAITTDVIVGFPGESEAEFQESLAFVREVGFAGGHVFNYSARPGTPAARLPGAVPSDIRRYRSTQMREVFQEASKKYAAQFIGKVVEVLWESTDGIGPNGWQLHGMTDHALRLSARHGQPLWNEISRVRVTGWAEDGLSGEIL